MPDNFDEMVDYQAEEMKQAQEEDEIVDVLDENGQPMWHKFVRPSYFEP